MTCSVSLKAYSSVKFFTICIFMFSILAFTTMGSSVNYNLVEFASASTSNNNLVLKNISVRTAPKGIFYDQVNHELYIANYGNKSISVINITTNSVIKVIPTSGSCWQFAYDPLNKNLYFSNDFANYIGILDTQNDTIVGNISTGSHKYDVVIIYNPFNNLLYVDSNQDNYLLAINTTTKTIVASIPIGKGAGNSDNIAIDKNGFIYVPNHISDTINIIDSKNNSVVKTVIVGKAPGATLFDPYNGYIYIALQGYVFAPQHTMLVFNPVTDKIIKQIPIGNLASALYYDQSHHSIFELNVQNDSLGIINDTTNTIISFIKIGSGASGIALPTESTNMYITDAGDNNVVYVNELDLLSYALQKPINSISTKTSPFISFPFITLSIVCFTIYKRQKKYN